MQFLYPAGNWDPQGNEISERVSLMARLSRSNNGKLSVSITVLYKEIIRYFRLFFITCNEHSAIRQLLQLLHIFLRHGIQFLRNVQQTFLTAYKTIEIHYYTTMIDILQWKTEGTFSLLLGGFEPSIPKTWFSQQLLGANGTNRCITRTSWFKH